MSKKEAIYEKVYTRENPLIAQEAWNKAFERDYDGQVNPYLPAVINYVNDGVVEIWENRDSFQWLKDKILNKNLNDGEFLEVQIEKHFKNLETLRVMAADGHLKSVNELQDFVSWLEDATHTFCAFYFSAYDERTPPELRTAALAVREKDNFYDTVSRLIKNTLEFLYPQIKGLTIAVIAKEIFSPPTSQILKDRFKHSIMPGHGHVEVIDLESFDKREEKFSFVFEKADNPYQIKGQTAMKGVAVGIVRILKRRDQITDVKDGEIIVSPMTTPDFLPAVKKSAALVTDEGGITSHAAIIAREMGKPCIIGTKVATQVFKDGDMVEVDANEGVVRMLNV